ncbi:MAG: D-3-phosphoglycerate dehydrogenase [Candidatus Magasanikbacteria bacterium GW2011_GWA2_56_11]|uniref:D-3-phosphoglycerate dehydrogenase n=1 Tax=Candidatus Magasanikbacteria bacterium GW2011_GWA2_56_11 TaxID=1619044 RepID=A0A0G2AM42_9BACT|nr:MAG: D-3-phosphoglycerate dehydrogenase [Candidatus Magasanikbacteria bacterium GW2011_GWA2_56_11]
MTYRILNTIGAEFDPEGKKLLERTGEVDYRALTPAELEGEIGNYDAALIGLGLHFSASVLARARKLKAIATATTGLDHVDLKAAAEKGIEILSLRGEEEFLNTVTGTAELALGLMLDIMRGLTPAAESVKRYEWERERFRGHNAYGRTLGIVGLGRLGRMMARYGAALGMRVVACDPYLSAADFSARGAEPADLPALLAQSDVVSIHVHLTAETEQMFNDARVRLMKPGSVLINTARGGIVDEPAVLRALEAGRLGGYGTDVLADEVNFAREGFASHPLVEYAKTHTNCLIVPHIGGMTFESRAATDVFMARKLARWLEANV